MPKILVNASNSFFYLCEAFSKTGAVPSCVENWAGLNTHPQFWCPPCSSAAAAWVSSFWSECRLSSWPSACWPRVVWSRDRRHCRPAPRRCSSARAWSGWCDSWCSRARVSGRTGRTSETSSSTGNPSEIADFEKVTLRHWHIVTLCTMTLWHCDNWWKYFCLIVVTRHPPDTRDKLADNHWAGVYLDPRKLQQEVLR